MMRPRRRGLDPMITMINVVFLLLAFFMLGQFNPPKPASIEIPSAQTGVDTDFDEMVFIDRTGNLSNVASQDLALEALKGKRIIVSADQNLDANKLIDSLSRLRGAGAAIVSLEVTP